ncbi:hypothetical protein F2Q69_00023188 [Brassica cretica]|uniref:Uncharacterized protein n=1 Tax=Brassica cretica TaxID=69181 RepID=A0A8S9QAA8_BRACR|nr:hypothetical protein F2Q69_00023188 [Brassica cretica]
MEGSPYPKSFISWKGGRSLGLVPGFLLAGTWSVPLSGTLGPGSCPEAGGNDAGVFFPNSSPLGRTLLQRSRCPRFHSSRSSFLNPERTEVFDMRFNPLGRRSNAGRVVLRVPLVPRVPETGTLLQRSRCPRFHSSRSSFLNPERTEVFDMRFNPLGRRSNAGRVVLRVPLVPRVPETGPFLLTLSVSEMKAESGLFPDSSSIDPKAIVALNVLPVAEGNRYPPIGPLLVIGVEEVADWRMKYNLPADVIIRVPGSQNKVSDFCVNEILVYEGYFESGFRDRVPSLVAKISETLEIFPEWRYYLRPRGKEPPVREVPKRERKSLPVFAGNWTEKFAFMRLPGFLPIWQLEGRLAVGVTMGDYRAGVEASYRATPDPFSRKQGGVKALQHLGIQR